MPEGRPAALDAVWHRRCTRAAAAVRPPRSPTRRADTHGIPPVLGAVVGSQEIPVADLAFVFLTLAFFAGAAAYVVACDRLGAPR